VLRALEYAHARGVVHRDIKPSNVIVREDDTSMVMDFGIAKITRESSRLTSTGQTMGTVRYMSPEQVRGAQVDFKSDLYSVGCSLYEAIVGDTPFDGNTHFDIMTKHLSEQPPAPRQHGVEIPIDLELELMKSMTKDPAGRHESAIAFRQALEQCLATAASEGLEIAWSRPPQVAALASSPAPQPPQPPEVERTNPLSLEKAGVSLSKLSAEDRVTGLAESLEPSDELAAFRPKRRTGLWVGLGVLVLGAAAAVLVFMKMQRSGTTEAGAGGGLTAAKPWPEPLVVAGLVPQVDKTFDGGEQVRIISPRQIDAAHLALVYQAARARFATYLAAKSVGKSFEVHPLNLVVAPPAVMCSRELWNDTAEGPPADCANSQIRFRYLAKPMTLYVLDSEELEPVNLPEGAAAHLCRSTLALLELGCNKNLLPPFWDEIEAGAQRQAPEQELEGPPAPARAGREDGR
jgi:hypothetical protein